MPHQIDKCRSCAAPIFDADGVTGACACNEGIYNTLLARQRLENNRGRTRTASTATDYALVAMGQKKPEPPELDLTMFLSPAARREVEAAQQMASMPRFEPGQGRSRPGSFNDAGDEPSFLDGLTLEDAPQESYGGIEFSTGEEDIDFGDGSQYHGGRQGRFRVDRPTPAREPFNNQRVSGPQGGPMQEVARVHGFPLLREVEAPSSIAARERATEIREALRNVPSVESSRPQRTQDQYEASKLNARQQEKRASLHESLPTAYERVAGDFLSDADDFD